MTSYELHLNLIHLRIGKKRIVHFGMYKFQERAECMLQLFVTAKKRNETLRARGNKSIQ